MVKTTFPSFKSSIRKTRKPLLNIIEIAYHTILPIIITYLIVTYELPFLFILLLVPILIRFEPEILTRTK